MVQLPPTQLGPGDKFQFSPFLYAKAIVKDNATYPIVPNCPIINANENGNFAYQNIPVGTFFIVHFSDGDIRTEVLCLRVPNDTRYSDSTLEYGYIIITSRSTRSR